ncbi:MAG: hypothetical protein OXC72_10960 [Roseovarius sp.]|nr:hypothetical protein [Roseovarius sp.]
MQSRKNYPKPLKRSLKNLINKWSRTFFVVALIYAPHEHLRKSQFTNFAQIGTPAGIALEDISHE